MNDQMAEAVRNQMRHVAESHRIDRRGWTDDQWIADAERLMNDLDGSVLDLLNGHVMRLLRWVKERGDTVAILPGYYWIDGVRHDDPSAALIVSRVRDGAKVWKAT